MDSHGQSERQALADANRLQASAWPKAVAPAETPTAIRFGAERYRGRLTIAPPGECCSWTPIRRPTLIGAVLLKARALTVHSRPEDQRQDLITLLSLLGSQRTARTDLKTTEISWPRNVEAELNLNDNARAPIFDPAQLRAARAAYQVLIAEKE